jgi:hypothetical protein
MIHFTRLPRMIETHLPLIDDILGSRNDVLGNDFTGYRNHVYRMVNFCFAQATLGDDAKKKIVIAGCFHDIGIWTAETFDYLPPSIEEANDFLLRSGLEKWVAEIGLMIDQHHKLREYPTASDSLVEIFRKGDLVDFSLGIVKCGVPGAYVKEVRAAFPNAGFHKQLVRLASHWFCRHPLDPVPVLKW